MAVSISDLDPPLSALLTNDKTVVSVEITVTRHSLQCFVPLGISSSELQILRTRASVFGTDRDRCSKLLNLHI